GATKTM
ncbi:rhs element Vgr family protein, partial [Vibrio cholerae HC-59A1]